MTKALGKITPLWREYERQSKAAEDFTPLRSMVETRLMQALHPNPPVPDILNAAETVKANLSAIDQSAKGLDYVKALDLVRGAQEELDRIEAAMRLAEDQKGIFDLRFDEINRRLRDVRACSFPDLTLMQDELLRLASEIVAAGAQYNFARSFGLMDQIESNIAAYMAAYSHLVSAKDQYEARLPASQSRLSEIANCEFRALGQRQSSIFTIETEMEKVAAAEDYEAALSHLDKLPDFLDSYEAALELARLGDAFEKQHGEIQPRLERVSTCDYGPLTQLSEAIINDMAKAVSFSSRAQYTAGLRLLDIIRTRMDQFESDFAQQQAAESDYHLRRAAVFERFNIIAKCEYPALSQSAANAIAFHDEVMAFERNRDFISAAQELQSLSAMISQIEVLLAEIDSARREYGLRASPLISRLESSLVSDYAQLTDERQIVEGFRREMEGAALDREFSQALVILNEIERQLDALDAQILSIERIKAQYEQLYEAAKPEFMGVDPCTHAELKEKKAKIQKLKAEMLTAAAATDFDTALQKFYGAYELVKTFTEYDRHLAIYNDGLDSLKARLATVLGLTWKSTAKDKAAAEKLWFDMLTDVRALKFPEALAKKTELSIVLANLIARNELLKQKKAVCEKLLSDMKSQIEVVKKNKISAAAIEAKDVGEKYEKLLKLVDEDEYENAVEKADEVHAALEDFRDKIDSDGDAKEVYFLLKEMALAALASALAKAKDYPDLEKKFEKLNELRERMNSAESGEEWEVAGAKARALLEAVKDFDAVYEDLLKREVGVKARAEVVIGRLKTLTKEAKEKAEDEFEDAEKDAERITEGLKDKDFDRVEKYVDKLDDTLDEIEELLKSDAEVKAQYLEHLKIIDGELEHAKGSVFADKLKLEVEDVMSAYEKMALMAGDEDWRRAKQRAADVDAALHKFFDAEQKLTVDKVRFDERMSGLQRGYDIVTSVGFLQSDPISLAPKVAIVRALYAEAKSIGESDSDYPAALERAGQLRAKIDDILEQVKSVDRARKDMEDAKGKADGVIDKLRGILVDKVSDRLPGPMGDVIKTGFDVYDGPGSTYDALLNIRDAAGHIYDGDWDMARDKMLDAGGDMYDAGKNGLNVAVRSNPALKAVKEGIDMIEDAKEAYETLDSMRDKRRQPLGHGVLTFALA